MLPNKALQAWSLGGKATVVKVPQFTIRELAVTNAGCARLDKRLVSAERGMVLTPDQVKSPDEMRKEIEEKINRSD